MKLIISKSDREALAKRLMALVEEVNRSREEGSSRPGWVHIGNQAEGDIIIAAAFVSCASEEDSNTRRRNNEPSTSRL